MRANFVSIRRSTGYVRKARPSHTPRETQLALAVEIEMEQVDPLRSGQIVADMQARQVAVDTKSLADQGRGDLDQLGGDVGRA